MKHVLRLLLVVFPILMWMAYKVTDYTVGISKGETLAFVIVTAVCTFFIGIIGEEYD